jgi:hypothetical protein
MQCMVGAVGCVQCMVCAEYGYGGAVGVVCGVCSEYDGCRVTAMQCTIWRVVYAVYGGCNVGCVQCIRRVQSMLCAVYGGAVDVECGVCSGYDGCRVTAMQCTIWRVVYAVYGGCSVGCVQCIRRVQSMLCAVYGGAVDVECGVCSGYDGCRVTGVQGAIRFAVYRMWRVVGAVYGGCSVTRGQCTVRCAGYYVWRVVGAVYGSYVCTVYRM